MVTRLLQRGPLQGPRAVAVAIGAASVLVSLMAAALVTRIQPGYVPKPLVLLLGLAGAVILFTVAAEQVFLLWLVAAPLVQGVPSTSLGHTYDLAFFTAPALVVLCQTLARRGRGEPNEWFDFLPAAYVLLVFGSFLVTTNLIRTDAQSSLKVFFLNVALGPLLYYFVAFRSTSWLTATRVVRVVLLACSIEGAMAIVEWGTGWNLWHDTTWHVGVARSIGTLVNPAVLGAFVGAGVLVAIAVLAWDGPHELRRLAIATILVGVPGVLFTLTRGPILATVVVAIAALLFSTRTRLVAIGAIALSALLVTVAWPYISKSSAYQDRFSNSRNVEARVLLQNASLQLAGRKPILGWGYDSFDRVKALTDITGSTKAQALYVDQTTSHDTYLTVLVEYGSVGLLLFLLPWVVISARSLRRARAPSPDRWLLVAAPAAVAVVALNGATVDYRFFSFVPATPWLFLALARQVLRHEDEPESAS
jgi:O-antigen ligase